jgi:hypothetical protein
VGWALLGWKKREKQEERELGCSGSKEEREPRPDWAERRHAKGLGVRFSKISFLLSFQTGFANLI